MTPAQELELLQLEQEQRRRKAASSVASPTPPADASQISPIKNTISKMARPALEVGGAVVGGAVGAGAGGGLNPVTGAAGGALGYATGKSAADALDEFLGISEGPKDLADAAARIPKNIYSGAKMEALGLALHPVVKAVASTGIAGGKKLAGALFNVSDEALNAYLENPAAIKDAALEKLAQKLPKIAEKFGAVIKHFSEQASPLLSTSKYIQPSATDAGGAITRDEINSVLKSTRKKIGGLYGEDAKAAADTISDVAKDLSKLGPTASQSSVRGIVEKLDNNINWDKFWRAKETLSSSEISLIRLRGKLNELIKTKNPAYAEAMKPVDEAMTARGDFVKQFGLQKVKGVEGYTPKDLSSTRLNNALKEGKLETQRIAESTKKITGEDILKEVQNAKYNSEFFGERAVKPMTVDLLTLLGGGVGAAGGGPVGAGAGVLAGKGVSNAVAKYGGVGGARVLDLLSKLKGSGASIEILKDPILRRLVASRGVGLTGDSDTQIQNLLNMVR